MTHLTCKDGIFVTTVGPRYNTGHTDLPGKTLTLASRSIGVRLYQMSKFNGWDVTSTNSLEIVFIVVEGYFNCFPVTIHHNQIKRFISASLMGKKCFIYPHIRALCATPDKGREIIYSRLSARLSKFIPVITVVTYWASMGNDPHFIWIVASKLESNVTPG